MHIIHAALGRARLKIVASSLPLQTAQGIPDEIAEAFCSIRNQGNEFNCGH
jgi:hypothetical protein